MTTIPNRRFDDNLALVHERLGIDPKGPNRLVQIGFRVGDFENLPGQSLGSLAILWDASERGLTVAEVLPVFAEYLNAVVETPQGDDHPNIRALMRIDRAAYVGSVVCFSGTPIALKLPAELEVGVVA